MRPVMEQSPSKDRLQLLLPTAEVERRTSTSSTGSACKVPLCQNRNCSLKSHQLYGSRIAGRRRLNQSRQKLFPRQNVASVDALPKLPIEDDSPLLRPFFHHFFEVVFDRLAVLFRGPSVLSSDHKKRMLPIALTNSTYCMGLVLQSQSDVVSRRGVFEETKDSVYLYGRLMKAFQREIGNLPHMFAIELALLDICILLAYDLLYDRQEFVWHHWFGMQRLVQFAGGIEAITTASPYVVHVDRSCAVLFSQKPAFSRVREVMVASPSSGRYGDLFAMLNLQDDVLKICKEVAKLLETWEDVHDRRADAAYLHNRRDHLDERFTIMHSELKSLSLLDQCCLLAARIVEYPITWANYYPGNSSKHCVRICQLLQCGNLQPDLLRWILAAVLIAPVKIFDGRVWALKRLKVLIEEKYGVDVWTNSGRAREMELMSLYGFVWCRSALNQLFELLWTELETIGFEAGSDEAA